MTITTTADALGDTRSWDASFAFTNRKQDRELVSVIGNASWLPPLASRLVRMSTSDEAPSSAVLGQTLTVLAQIMPSRGAVLPSLVLSERQGVEIVWRANGLRISVEVDDEVSPQVEVQGLGLDVSGPLAAHRERVREAIAQMLA